MAIELPQKIVLPTWFILFFLSIFSLPSFGVAPVLERSAVFSTRATKSVLLAVANAGPRLVAVGERGIVLLSDDNGVTWQQAKAPVSVTLTGVRFVSSKKGWATGHGGVLLRTQDGGETWTKQFDGKSAVQAILDYFEKRKSTDSNGIVQQQLTIATRFLSEGPDKPFFGLYFSSEKTGFVVGAYNFVFRTDDGGETWLPWQDHVSNPKGMHLFAIGGHGSDIYIVGEQGSIFRSTDNGRSFAASISPYNGSYFGLLLEPTTGAVLAFGLRGNGYRSDDRGGNWKKVPLDTVASVTGGTILQDGRLVLVTQAGQLLISQDRGISFQPSSARSPAPLTDIVQAADGNLVCVGLRGVFIISLENAMQNK